MHGTRRPIILARFASVAAAAFIAAAPVAQATPAPSAPLLTSTDQSTGLPYEWQFAAADVAPALALSPGASSVVVGTIDSGAASIPDLAGKIDSRWTISSTGTIKRNSDGNDYVGHGTAVASLIAANGFGMAGFGGATHVIAIRVPKMTAVAVAAALLKLDSLGARIVNMSFGSPAPERPIVLAAMRKVEADGILLVAAAGNSSDAVAHPAADLQPPDGVESTGLAVGASDVDGNLAFFSNSGENLSLLAPGSYSGTCSGVLVAAPINDDFVDACYPSWNGTAGGSYAYVSGTSFAAPEVAGIAALIWAVRPGLTEYQVADIIKQSARRAGPGWTPSMGCGTLDAGAALELAMSRSDVEWALTPRPLAACTATP
jgi:subtilisin family serine protease